MKRLRTKGDETFWKSFWLQIPKRMEYGNIKEAVK